MRIIPYETPAPVHTAGLSIPLAAYVNLLYTAKSFSVECDITFAYASGSSVNYSITGSLDRQYFTGPEPIPSDDEGSWSSVQMMSGTRRVCHALSGNPLRYHDPGEYLAGSGPKVIAGWMNWFGTLSYSASTGASGTIEHNFYLPAFSYPLWWDLTSSVTSGIQKAAGASNWLIFQEGGDGCGVGAPPSAFYGSAQHVTSDPYNSITATLVTPGGTYTFLEAGPTVIGDDTVSGTCTITLETTW